MAESNPSTALQSFSFQSKQFRAVARDGEPWFVAADVCEFLQVTNARQAVSRLDDDEKGVISNDTLGGRQEVTVINEPGLYALILSSRNLKGDPERAEKIKAFKRWVTHEVLPSIRKKGSYQTAEAARELELADFVFYPCDYHGRHWVMWLNGLQIAVQPLFELLGLDWSVWQEWLRRDWAKWGSAQVGATLPTNGDTLPYVVPVSRVPGMLTALARDLPADRQALLERLRAGLVPAAELAFQTRHAPTAESLLANEPLSAEQQAQIKAAIRDKMRGTSYKQAAVLYLYGRLKQTFQVGQWMQIKRADFQEALALIAAEDGSLLLPNVQQRQLVTSNPPSTPGAPALPARRLQTSGRAQIAPPACFGGGAPRMGPTTTPGPRQ